MEFTSEEQWMCTEQYQKNYWNIQKGGTPYEYFKINKFMCAMVPLWCIKSDNI